MFRKIKWFILSSHYGTFHLRHLRRYILAQGRLKRWEEKIMSDSYFQWQEADKTSQFQFHFSRSVVSDSLRPMNRSTPGLPVHHHLLEFTQTHVHRLGDVFQPSRPLSSPSPPATNPSQHQGLFQ